MKRSLIGLVIALIALQPARALEIKKEKVYDSDLGEWLNAMFLTVPKGWKLTSNSRMELEKGRVQLNGAAFYGLPLYNADKTIAAVNYHVTSGCNDVHLLVEQQNQIWLLVRAGMDMLDEAVQAGLMRDLNWGRSYFEVQSIDGNTLHCFFSGYCYAEHEKIQKEFAVDVLIKDGKAQLRPRREPPPEGSR